MYNTIRTNTIIQLYTSQDSQTYYSFWIENVDCIPTGDSTATNVEENWRIHIEPVAVPSKP